jgi:hypothetical protein
VAEKEKNQTLQAAQIRSWVKNVIVPALVDEWLATHQDHNRIAGPLVAVAESESMSPVPIGRMVQ